MVELDEARRRIVDQNIKSQEKVKRNFDKSSRPRTFQKGDTVLLWDANMESSIVYGWVPTSFMTELVLPHFI